MNEFIEIYLEDKKAKGQSTATLTAYRRDLKAFLIFLEKNGLEKVERLNKTNILAYLFEQKKNGKSSATINRSLSTLRGFFKFLRLKGILSIDPTTGIEVPKIERETPEVLTIEEVEKIINSVETTTQKGIRDKAMLELLYASGIRVSEIIKLTTDNVNLNLRLLTVNSNKKVRLVPFNESCYDILWLYFNSREGLKEKGSILFPNVNGEPMSRQGFWKIIKGYAKKAGIEKEITPQTFRHCFAAHLSENGISPEDLGELLGVEDLKSIQIYKNTKEKRLMDIYKNAHPRK